jgi:hypothetical protein
MSAPAEDSITAPRTSTQELDQLRSTALRLASGLNLLRCALILLLAGWVLDHLAWKVVSFLWFHRESAHGDLAGSAWIILAGGMVQWPVWPLALLGFLKLRQAVGARIAPLVVAATIACFVLKLVSVPLHDVAAFLRLRHAVEIMPESEVFWYAESVITTLLELAALFMCARLAHAANEVFGGGVIRRSHVSGLLWTGVGLVALTTGSWIAWQYIGPDPSEAVDPEADSLIYLAVWSVPFFLFVVWQCWLLVAAWLARRRLMLFIRYDRCPRCGCQVLSVEGCPKCGLGRQPAPSAV